MKNLFTMIALLVASMAISQNPHWVVYDFEVQPNHESAVVSSFDRFFATETGKMLPSASLSATMFANSKTKFTHRIVFWSDDGNELGKLYSSEMQQSKDAALLFMNLNSMIKPVASYLGKALIWGPSEDKSYSTAYILSVSDPATYAAAFTEMRTALLEASAGKLSLDLHQIISGNEPGATHAVVASAASFPELLEMTDMVFSSDAYKKFATTVKDIREITNIFSLYRAKMYNVGQ